MDENTSIQQVDDGIGSRLGEIPVLGSEWVDLAGKARVALGLSGNYVKIRDHEGECSWITLDEAITLGEMAKRYKASQELKAVLASMPEDVPQEALESLPADYRIVTEDTYNRTAPFASWFDDGDGWIMSSGIPSWIPGVVYAQAVGDAKP